MKKPLLSLVVPFYNEEETIDQFFPRVQMALEAIAAVDYEIVCVNDGSRDRTLLKLIECARGDARIHVVELSRNFGKEAALTAGLNEALGDVVIPFDADLQDPPEMIAEMVAKWQEGFDVVVARRADRASDTFMKRFSAAAFYRMHNMLSEVKIPENVGDFRLMSREVVDALKMLPESRRFMKGLFSWVGFRTATISYTRESRVAGKTKFSAWKLWNFALEGLTSFGTLPLRVWSYLGVVVALFSLVYASYLVIRTIVLGIDVPGYASIITAILFLGGVQLIGIGIVGEYVGRIYMESKHRPVYLVRARFRAGERRS
ncbi:glycosyl transferase family protein [Caballeronia temeraria]|uniref:Glycosyl transferase family protein n=1 Tax=Caballeronia temeraria TaxID=1777137 RepID=A0A158C289_9BURK|nr:glycosyltransferase family 2 protein [Caballeronia temeraria]SAK76474.1 glycosyl transferase family protein [Caballeronia temeraria]